MAESKNAEAQYILAYEFYWLKHHDASETIKWCLRAADLGHKLALHYLTTTLFTVDQYLFIAIKYEGAEEIALNINRAMEFYKKASHLGSPGANFRLAQLHENFELGPIFNQEIAFKYYLLAAKKSHPAALVALERLALLLRNNDLDFKLAELYHDVIKDKVLSLKWYKKAREKGSVQASNRLKEISRADPEFAYATGLLYEQDMEGEQNLEIAIQCYAMALRNNNFKALDPLMRLAHSGHAWAQYALAREYYLLKQKNILEAIRWCMRAADSGHELASAYLRETEFTVDQYSAIATRYEEGAEVVVNLAHAATFYDKASQLGGAEASFRLGQLHEKGLLGEKNLQKAIAYYAVAIRYGHRKAEERIATLAERGNADAQYVYAYDYFHSKRQDVTQAAIWCMQASEQGHELALKYLRESVFSAELNSLIATRYEQGRMVAFNITRAIEFYNKASNLKNDAAAFRLAELCETGALGVLVNKKLAFKYYLVAARKVRKDCLEPLERLADELESSECDYQLAELFFNVFHDKTRTLKWCKKSADRGYIKAQHVMRTISNMDPEFAYAAAQLYEEVALTKRVKDSLSLTEINAHEILSYIVLATRNHHPEARKWLEAKATAGQVNVQYALGYVNFHYDNNRRRAVFWFMKAANEGHEQALRYLTDQNYSIDIYLNLAKCYEEGLGVAIDINRSIQFYTKAYAVGARSLALKLGKLHEKKVENTVKNKEIACEYYFRAYHDGVQEAWDSLQSLFEDINVGLQSRILALDKKISSARSSQTSGSASSQVGLFGPRSVAASLSSLSASLVPRAAPGMKSRVH